MNRKQEFPRKSVKFSGESLGLLRLVWVGMCLMFVCLF